MKESRGEIGIAAKISPQNTKFICLQLNNFLWPILLLLKLWETCQNVSYTDPKKSDSVDL